MSRDALKGAPSVFDTFKAALAGGVAALIVAPVCFVPILALIHRPPVAQSLEGIFRTLAFVGVVALVMGLASSLVLVFPTLLLMRRFNFLSRPALLALGAVIGSIMGALFVNSVSIQWMWASFGAVVGVLCAAIAAWILIRPKRAWRGWVSEARGP